MTDYLSVVQVYEVLHSGQGGELLCCSLLACSGELGESSQQQQPKLWYS